MRGKIGPAEVGQARGVSEEVSPVQGAVAGGENDFAACALGKRESRS